MQERILPDSYEGLRICRNSGVRFSQRFLRVNVQQQRVFEYRLSKERQYCLWRGYLASTSAFGVGNEIDSQKTPLGLHCIARKVGGGFPQGTVFKGRVPIGYTWQGMPKAKIAHRIMWLSGLEEGKNKGGRVDSFQRYIYIHGVGDELTLGRPASHGCIHLAVADLMPLYERCCVGDLVWIEER